MTRKNTKPRRSSPRGIQARHDARLTGCNADQNGKRQPSGGIFTFHKPGSRNPRKVSR